MLSAAMLDGMAEGLLGRAGKNLSKEGYVAPGIFGMRPIGDPVVILPGAGPGEPHFDKSGILLLPGQPAQWQELIRDTFRSAGVHAAVMLGEYWTFPPGDRAAARDFVEGQGVPPSEHPHRVEGVYVLTVWPMGGYIKLISRRLVRVAGNAYLRRWDPQDEIVQSPATTVQSSGSRAACPHLTTRPRRTEPPPGRGP